ncbi:MAG: hypothetical protein ABJN26_09040 [Stappiaceae bacterium]
MSEVETVSKEGSEVTVFRNAPGWDGMTCAALGRAVFENFAAGQELLEEVCDQLKEEGFDGVLGPMDGDTWHSYRVVTQSDGSAPFLMEPASGQYDLEIYRSCGFEAISTYFSSRAALTDTLSEHAPSMPDIVVEPWDGKDAEGLIGQLFNLSGQSFADNHFFKAIELDAFLELYRPLLPLIDPRHVLFARTAGEGRLVGFLFGIPDALNRSERKTVILKTYASGIRGVGHLLADTFHRRALDMGFDDVIHALIHSDNVSGKRSAQHQAMVFRQYALMGRRL